MTINPPDSALPPRDTSQVEQDATWERFRDAFPLRLYRFSTQLQGDVWAAAFDHTYVTDGIDRYWAVSGHGATEQGAIVDYQRRISGRMIAISIHPEVPIERSPSKQLIEVPYWPSLFDGGGPAR